MHTHQPHVVRIHAFFQHVAMIEGWCYHEADLSRMTHLMLTYAPRPHHEAQLRTVIKNLWHDAHDVEALRSEDHHEHARVWADWMAHARAILRHNRLDWARDTAVDFDDLAQIAMLELSRSLPSYGYRSRFSTWAYQVITRGVQRHLRNLAAKKRAAVVDHRVDPLQLMQVIADCDHPEARICDQALHTLITESLVRVLGVRNAQVFTLWVCDDLSAEMIGHRIGLSTPRVHAILTQARQYLRGYEPVLRWRDAAYGEEPHAQVVTYP